METRKLGSSGLEFTTVGIGAMSFINFYGTTTEDEAHAILDAAVEAGVNHIDTSDAYGAGRSEEIIGRFLARYRDNGRLPFQIATKAGIHHDPETKKRCFNNSEDYLEACLDKSLARLGVERVELFYVHRRDPDTEIEEVTEALAGLAAKGKIASFGFSEIAPTSLERAAAVSPVAAVQSEYSLQTRLPELGVVQACERLQTSLVAFSPVGRGLLSDDPPTPARVTESAFLSANPRFLGDNLDRNIAASQPLRDMARELGQPTAALAIAWLLAQSQAVVAIPGTHNPAHFGELVAGANLKLNDEILSEINRRFPPGWTHGARYSTAQSVGPEHYC